MWHQLRAQHNSHPLFLPFWLPWLRSPQPLPPCSSPQSPPTTHGYASVSHCRYWQWLQAQQWEQTRITWVSGKMKGEKAKNRWRRMFRLRHKFMIELFLFTASKIINLSSVTVVVIHDVSSWKHLFPCVWSYWVCVYTAHQQQDTGQIAGSLTLLMVWSSVFSAIRHSNQPKWADELLYVVVVLRECVYRTSVECVYTHAYFSWEHEISGTCNTSP